MDDKYINSGVLLMNLDFINPMSWLNSFLRSLCEGIVLSSYWICVIGGVVGLILYLFGLKKGKDYAFIAPAIYMIIRIIGGVLLGI